MPAHRKELKIEGSNLWYLVGLITADGCLSSDGRHIDITSKDYNFLQEVEDATGIMNKIGIKYNAKRQRYFHIQIGNKNFYEFLVSAGLTSNKSLTIREVKVPSQYFVDFFRGLIDGDGCIRRWRHPTNNREQWSLRIYSGSERFIDWLDNIAEQRLGVRGKTYKNANNTWVLKYGKIAAKHIAEKCYYKDCLGLDRKMKLVQSCLGSYEGWSRSKTVFH
jgi:hypothetical protein